MSDPCRPDFGLTAADYGRHRAGFPDELAVALAARGIGLPAQTVLDVGTGTGSLARLLATRVRAVIGIDPAEPLLSTARELDRAAGVEIDYHVATAEQTGLPDAAFDIATAGQCWHWFDAAAAGREIMRVLKPGGTVVIAHFDWLPLSGNVVSATEELILSYNPRWHLGGGTGLYPRWLTDLAVAGFTGIETFSFDVTVPYQRAVWIGRIRASAGVAASLSPDEVERFSDDLAGILRRDFPDEALVIPHRTWVVTATKRHDNHDGDAR